jgi:threonine/homoserine/homoserine lactone efflux protein
MPPVDLVIPPLLVLAVVHLLAVMSPGPSFVVVSRISLTSGRPSGLAAALACGIGEVPWAIAALAGVAFVFANAPWLYAGLKVLGGAYLIYLAIQIWRHADTPVIVMDTERAQPLGAAFRETFVTHVANPKIAVFFSSIFVSVLPAEPPLWMLAAILVIVFINALGWFALVALGFSAPRPRAIYLQSKPWLDRVMAALLGALGVKLLADARNGV